MLLKEHSCATCGGSQEMPHLTMPSSNGRKLAFCSDNCVERFKELEQYTLMCALEGCDEPVVHRLHGKGWCSINHLREYDDEQIRKYKDSQETCSEREA